MTAAPLPRRLSDRAIIAATLAIVFGTMAAGQVILRYGFGITYGSEAFLRGIAPALLLMLALLAWLSRTISGAPAGICLAPLPPIVWRILAGVAVFIVVRTVWLVTTVPETARAEHLSQVAAIIIVIGLVAVTEELAFRGLILGALDRMAGPIVAVGASALLFSAYHAVNLLGGRSLDQVAGQMLGSALFGAALGVVTCSLRNIAPAIAGHWLLNAMPSIEGLASLAGR